MIRSGRHLKMGELAGGITRAGGREVISAHSENMAGGGGSGRHASERSCLRLLGGAAGRAGGLGGYQMGCLEGSSRSRGGGGCLLGDKVGVWRLGEVRSSRTLSEDESSQAKRR